MTSLDLILQFIDHINQHDPDNLAQRVTEDHRFTDSLGNTIRGREAIRKAWRGYSSFCHAY